jgi:cilia- and flagella-associated protein 52
LYSFRRFTRSQVLFENTLFQCVAYHPEEYHIITGGTDRKIAYWESTNGAQIRELEASKSGTINGLDIDSAGNSFVTVSADKLVKVKSLILLSDMCTLVYDLVMALQRR